MEENLTSIAAENAKRLASLSTAFCFMNNIPVTPELVPILSNAVLSGIAKWYSDRGRTFDPENDRIEDDALAEAFARVQEIAILAAFSALTGIGMEEFGN
jgi:hypothetical protein